MEVHKNKITQQEALKQIHKVNLKLLQEVDRVCKKNNIEYFLSSGTLLGAVRDSDFIAWDDDVDILIKRKEFEKLLSCRHDFSEDFELILPVEYPRCFFDTIPKLNYIKSSLRKENEEELFYCNKHNCISLDFFILDSTYDDFRGKLQRLHLKILYGMAMGWRYHLDFTKYTLFQKVYVGILSTLGKMSSPVKILKKYDKVSQKYNHKEKTKYMISDSEMQFLNNTYEKDLYASVQSGRIQSLDVPIPVGYDTILKTLYGNYMELPPVEKRIPRHTEFKDLQIWN